MDNWIKLKPFKYFCSNTLPTVYDDSMSYYELLCKIIEYLNNVIFDVNLLNNSNNDLENKFNELKNYVDNYFNNLDVQEEINNKLDEMVEDGTLQELLNFSVKKINSSVFFQNKEMTKDNLQLLLNSYDIVVVDSDITIFDVENNNPFMFIGNSGTITTNSPISVKNSIIFNDVNITGEGYLLNIDNALNTYIPTIKIINSNISTVLIDYNVGTFLEAPKGIGELIVENNNIENLADIGIIIYDMPCQKCSVSYNNIHNIQKRFIAIGASNSNPYNVEIKNKINCVFNGNNVLNDDNIYMTNTQYFTPFWTKCNTVEAINNNIQNIAGNQAQFNGEDCECFCMYLLANNVVFNNNIVKNIYNFKYNTNNYEMTSILPNIKAEAGNKQIKNNTFILEKTWLQKQCTLLEISDIDSLQAPPLYNLYSNGDNVDISGNKIDVYFCYLTFKGYFINLNITFNNNVLNIEKTSNIGNNIFAALSSGNLIFNDNIVTIENTERFTILYASGENNSVNGIIKSNIFNIYNCTSIPSLVYELGSQCIDNILISDNLLNFTISSVSETQAVVLTQSKLKGNVKIELKEQNANNDILYNSTMIKGTVLKLHNNSQKISNNTTLYFDLINADDGQYFIKYSIISNNSLIEKTVGILCSGENVTINTSSGLSTISKTTASRLYDIENADSNLRISGQGYVYLYQTEYTDLFFEIL